MMIGSRGWRSRTFWRVASPLIPPIRTSMITRSGGPSASLANASSPERAETTSASFGRILRNA